MYEVFLLHAMVYLSGIIFLATFWGKLDIQKSEHITNVHSLMNFHNLNQSLEGGTTLLAPLKLHPVAHSHHYFPPLLPPLPSGHYSLCRSLVLSCWALYFIYLGSFSFASGFFQCDVFEDSFMSLQAEHSFPCHVVFHYETVSKFTYR